MTAMQEVRCKNCGKKLGVISGKAEIKCPRCGRINFINTKETGTLDFVEKNLEDILSAEKEQKVREKEFRREWNKWVKLKVEKERGPRDPV